MKLDYEEIIKRANEIYIGEKFKHISDDLGEIIAEL